MYNAKVNICINKYNIYITSSKITVKINIYHIKFKFTIKFKTNITKKAATVAVHAVSRNGITQPPFSIQNFFKTKSFGPIKTLFNTVNFH
jgi:hypothetical protein